jgi:type III secretory pathway component EscR
MDLFDAFIGRYSALLESIQRRFVNCELYYLPYATINIVVVNVMVNLMVNLMVNTIINVMINLIVYKRVKDLYTLHCPGKDLSPTARPFSEFCRF